MAKKELVRLLAAFAGRLLLTHLPRAPPTVSTSTNRLTLFRTGGPATFDPPPSVPTPLQCTTILGAACIPDEDGTCKAHMPSLKGYGARVALSYPAEKKWPGTSRLDTS